MICLGRYAKTSLPAEPGMFTVSQQYISTFGISVTVISAMLNP